METNISKDINYYLDTIQVTEVEFSNFVEPVKELFRDWYVVQNEHSDIAMFEHEQDACRFRLDYINYKLNSK